jgi:tyrosyl-tRNA synthetase
VPKKIEGNGVIAFVEHVIFRVLLIKNGHAEVVVERKEGEPLVYTDIAQLKKDYENDIVSDQGDSDGRSGQLTMI